MASQGPRSPGTLANDTAVGTVAWTDPGNAAASDDSRASFLWHIGSTTAKPIDSRVSIVKSDASVGTTNKAAPAAEYPTTDTYYTYGSSSDLWGESWSASDINHANFGVVLSAATDSGDGLPISNYLKATNFGFSVPSGSVDGIVVEIERRYSFATISKQTYNYADVDHIRITVYYTETASGLALLKTVNGLAKASVKTVNGLAIASVKTWDGLA